jgi:hypothetical protein
LFVIGVVSDEFVSVKAINLRRSADALHLAVNEDRHKLLPAPSFLAPFARCQFSFLLCHEFNPLPRVSPRAALEQPFQRGLALHGPTKMLRAANRFVFEFF